MAITVDMAVDTVTTIKPSRPERGIHPVADECPFWIILTTAFAELRHSAVPNEPDRQILLLDVTHFGCVVYVAASR